jgi:hypothetical protein
MKTLKDHTLLYDADCPICRLYTGYFVNKGLLDSNGRHPFQQLPADWKDSIDTERAQSEIALINRKTAEVHYGVDALILVVTHRFPALKELLQLTAIRWFLQRLYAFVSYNRKVIAGAQPAHNAVQDCTPAYSFKYRALYLIVAWLFTAFVLNAYSGILTGLIPASNIYRELAIAGGQIIFQGAILLFLNKQKLMDYFGNMMTVSVVGALLLLPALGVHALFGSLPQLTFAGYFMLVAGFMLLEHARRMKVLGLGWVPSAAWVLYRMLVLVAILYL